MKPLCSKLSKIFSNKWTISSSGSTVQVVWAAVPVLIRAASSWAGCLMFSALLVGSHLGKLCLHGDNGQSAAVAAQYKLSGQQYQFSLGQHPAGQDVSCSPHCLLAAILESFVFMETNGQSAAVAAQYRLSGQQYQFSLGQHPAGQDVSCSPHCLLA